MTIKRYKHAKLGISTLHLALLAARESLSLEGTWHASRTLHTLAQSLAVGLKKGHHCTFRVLYQMYSRILDCLYIVIELKEKYSPNKTLPLKYINPVMYSRVKGISKNVMKSWYLLKSALSFRQLPAQESKLIESSLGNLSLWIEVHIPSTLRKETIESHRTHKFPVIVSNGLAREAIRMDVYLAIQFVKFKQDPTWVSRTNTEDILEVSVCFKGNYNQTCYYPKMLKFGIEVAFDISNIISKVNFTKVTVRRLEPYIDSYLLEMELPVYRLDPLPLAYVEAHFRLHANDTELLVLVKKDIRPTYDEVMKEGSKVTPTRPVYPVVTEPSDKQHLYYLAIQPGPQVKQKRAMSIDVKIYSKLCYTWHYIWDTRGCRSKTDPDTGDLICECHRLSLISGLVEELAFPLEIMEGFPLSLTISSHYMTRLLSFLLLMLAFLLLALICKKADRYDRTKRYVSVLPDNLPADRYGYLICVITGARVGAGTDAAVGIKIYGTANDGRRHILSSQTHSVMEEMGEDWFLTYESEKLGKILYLDLWHDNTDSKANWFCDSIIVYDLQHKVYYVFLMNDWISLSYKQSPQVSLFPAPVTEITSSSRLFLDYLKFGFRLSHLWLDTIVRHPRDPVSRVDRLAIILCYILVSMAVSIVIIASTDNHMELDDFSFSMKWLMVKMSVYTCLIATAFACLLMCMFRNIYKIIFHVENQEEKVNNKWSSLDKTKKERISYKRKVSRVSRHEDYLSVSSTMLFRDVKCHIKYGERHSHLPNAQKTTFAQAIHFYFMPKPLVPVQLEGDEPNVIIGKGWLFATWITILLIALACMILSLNLATDLPPIKTKKWFTIVMLTVFIHAFLLLPLKITLVSAILAVSFNRIIYKDVYTFDPRDGRQLMLFGNLTYLANFLNLRAKQMYYPLLEVVREQHRQRMLRAAQWRRLYELVVQVMFLVVLGSLLRAQILTQQQTNTHLRTLMKDIYEVYNTTKYLTYLQYHCNPYLFKYIWYNWKLASDVSELNFFRKYWMYDSVNRMVGKVRLRQFRVEPGYCKASVNLSIDCAAPFSGRAEDSRDYVTFWTSQDDILKKDEFMGIQLLNNWSYTWPRDDSNFFYYGETGQTYPSGGYSWDLGASDEELEASLLTLREEGWVGHYTRAVLAQVISYNVNTHIFSEMVLVSEQTIAGQILSTIMVYSVDINLELDWLLMIFIFFAFMLCVRIFTLTNFFGVIGLFRNWRRPYELLMTVNALAVLLYLLLHHLTVPQYVTEYQLHSEELKFFDFYKIAHYSFTARSLLCALYILNQMRFYSLWRFGKTVFRFFMTIVLSMKYVFWIIGIYVLFQILLFRVMGYLFLIFIDVVFNPNMFYRSNYSYFFVSNEKNGFKLLCFTMCFSSVIIMMFFASVFVSEYKTSRDKLIRDWNVDNYFTFVVEEITNVEVKPVVRRTAHSILPKRW